MRSCHVRKKTYQVMSLKIHILATTGLTEGSNLAKSIGHTPDTLSEAAKLDNLRMIDEEVHVGPELADVPVEHLWIRRLEHDPLRRELAQDVLDDVGPPLGYILSDAFALNHYTLNAGFDESLAHASNFARV